MKYKLVIKPLAEVDLKEIANWYESKKPGLGLAFLEAVDSKIQLLTTNPKTYQKRYRETRLTLVKKFPYAIHYTLEKNLIYVHAVLSTSRNPKIWNDRTN
ncbi:MAG: type II toxin-antitoxin system RelE/ParE family toxin [Reichenbachiella sp.]|uniref:type II toxin-antitoxin system RelE/ParE family toxin n=1 Tax=Reichenbachiella sp. TaxID=2184521 RepID=UPI00329A2469